MERQKRKTWSPVKNREDDRRKSCKKDTKETAPDFVNESQNIYNRDGDSPYA